MHVEIDTGTGEREERNEDADARLARRHVLLSRHRDSNGEQAATVQVRPVNDPAQVRPQALLFLAFTTWATTKID